MHHGDEEKMRRDYYSILGNILTIEHTLYNGENSILTAVYCGILRYIVSGADDYHLIMV